MYSVFPDLDDYIKNGGSLSKILPPANSPHSQQMEPAPPPRSLFRGVSVHTYRSADGVSVLIEMILSAAHLVWCMASSCASLQTRFYVASRWRLAREGGCTVPWYDRLLLATTLVIVIVIAVWCVTVVWRCHGLYACSVVPQMVPRLLWDYEVCYHAWNGHGPSFFFFHPSGKMEKFVESLEKHKVCFCSCRKLRSARL